MSVMSISPKAPPKQEVRGGGTADGAAGVHCLSAVPSRWRQALLWSLLLCLHFSIKRAAYIDNCMVARRIACLKELALKAEDLGLVQHSEVVQVRGVDEVEPRQQLRRLRQVGLALRAAQLWVCSAAATVLR